MKTNIIKLYKYEFKTNIKTIIAFPLIITALSSLYLFLFKNMQELAKSKIEAMPKELLKVFNISSFNEISKFNSYFNMIFGVFSIIIIIYLITFSFNIIKKEENNKTIELLNGLPVDRSEIYFSKYLLVLTLFILVHLGIFVIAFISGLSFKESSFEIGKLISVIKISGFSNLFYITLSFVLAASFKTNIHFGLIFFGFSYLYGYLITLLEKGNNYLVFSAYHIFNPNNAILFDNFIVFSLFIYFVIFIILIFIGKFLYSKRDFNI